MLVAIAYVGFMDKFVKIEQPDLPMEPVAVVPTVPALEVTVPVPRDCGGTREKRLSQYWEMNTGYDQFRGKVANARNKSCFKTALREQVVRY